MTPDIKIKQLSLHDFRRWDNHTVEFNDKVTAFTGTGKTSLLDAIAVTLNIVKYRLVQDRTMIKTYLYDDIKIGKDRATITPVFNIDDDPKNYKASFRVQKHEGAGHRYEIKRKNYNLTEVNYVATTINHNFREYEKLPIFSYWTDSITPLDCYYRRTANLDINPIKTYTEALTHYSSKAMFWTFITMVARHALSVETSERDTDEKYQTYKQMQEIINDVCPFLDQFHVSRDAKWHSLTKSDKTKCRPEMLSKREISTLHFVGDLLYRIFLANVGNLADPYGIVLIDDFETVFTDKSVIDKLHEHFPQLQFIVTTKQPDLFDTVSCLDEPNPREMFWGIMPFLKEEKPW